MEPRLDLEQLAAALRDNERLLRASHEVSPIAFAYLRVLRERGSAVDFEYLFQNEAASRINGLGAGTRCSGRRVVDTWPTLPATEVFQRYREVADGGGPWQGEIRFRARHVDGWFRLTVAAPTHDTLAIAFEDVTERRLVSDRLARLQRLTAALSAARSIEDVGRVAVDIGCEATEAATAALLTVEDDVLSLVAARGITEDTRRRGERLPRSQRTPATRAVAERAPVFAANAAELGEKFPDLQSITSAPGVATCAYPLIVGERVLGALALRFAVERTFDDSEREFLGAIASQIAQALDRASHWDIAEATRAELEREREQLRVMLEEMPVGVFVFKGDGTLAIQNRAAAAMWGGAEAFDAATTANARVGAVEAFHADGRRIEPGELTAAALLRGGRLAREEIRVVRGDGSTGWLTVQGAPLVGEDGRAAAAVVVMTDVTRIKAAEEHASSARRDAQRASRAKDEFLAMLGHELRNPLAPIVTALALMRRPERGGDGHAREREVIERQVQHLTRLVDDLLDVSRIAHGAVDLRSEVVSVRSIVARALEAASPLLDRRGHHVELAIEDGLDVRGDPVRLTQVVSNLLTNAAKYTPVGGRIRVEASRDGHRAVLRVSDNGVGLAPDLLPRVFDMFTQGRQALDRSEGGLGLGLSIVKSLVELHGGEVLARSEGADRGSEFEVRLPTASPPPIDASAPTHEPTPGTAQHGARVLIVDDNEDAAEMLAMYLDGEGYAVRVAADGPSALAIAESFAPPIVLLDLGLPVMDGFEVAERFRSTEAMKGAWIAAVTGYGEEEDRARTAAAGFDAHLTKPLDLHELSRLLADRLARV